MLADSFRRLMFQTNIYELMAGCFYFITYKFNVCGWHISLLNVIVVCESFDIMMRFIGRMFGKEEVQD